MILTNRRIRLLYLALAAQDVAVLLPWLATFLTFWQQRGDLTAAPAVNLLIHAPIVAFLGVWALCIGYMLCADLLDRTKLAGAGALWARNLLLLALLTGTSLLLVRAAAYPDRPWSDLSWLRETIIALINLRGGVRGEMLLVLANYLLWLRIVQSAGALWARSLTFFGVSRSFRLGMLFALLGNALLAHWMRQPTATTVTYLLLFFVVGLTAVALARIDQKALGANNSSGALLPWPRFAQILIATLLLVGAGWLIGQVYTPANLRAILSWFAPVGRLIEWLVTGIVFAAFWLLTPIIEFLLAQLQGAVAETPQLQWGDQPPPDPLQPADMSRQMALLRYCLSAGVIVTALVLALLFFARSVARLRRSEDEETDLDSAGLRPGRFGVDMTRLRDWLALLGRYGAGSRLLDAVTVENIYANLVRLARRKGFPRRQDQTPDAYLPQLRLAFPAHDDELLAITRLYARARYGEHAPSAADVRAARAAYATILADHDTGAA